MKRYFTLLAITLFANAALSSESCPLVDPGHAWSRAVVEFQRDVSHGYCRVVGDKPNWFIRCSINKKNAGCKTLESNAIPDMGYENSQHWADKNDDGYIDFCRAVGNAPFTFLKCALGPEFNRELDIK